VAHWKANVVFFIHEPSQLSDGQFGNDFGNKDYASSLLIALLAPDIKAQVHLVEGRVERNRKRAEKFRAPKLESDQADVGLPILCIEHGARRHIMGQDLGVTLVVQHFEVSPLRSEEGAHFAEGRQSLQANLSGICFTDRNLYFRGDRQLPKEDIRLRAARLLLDLF
jgi:hypothetical protein